jgi:DNA-binding MarR family transcriptional regulator
MLILARSFHGVAMTTTAKEQALADRIARRLASEDVATFRAGGRAVALQAIEHRVAMVERLRGLIARRQEQVMDDRRRGYHEALEDLLLAAEAALAPVEREELARHALEHEGRLRALLEAAAAGPLTPGEAAQLTGKSLATGTRDLDRLVELGLATELPAADGRLRWHRASPLGRRLLAAADHAGAARSALARAAAVTADDDEDPVAAVATVSVAQR